ncbi:MAG: MaoC family dehydratase N-terminal domain-containing protein [Chloroflexi bacterium]|nr:MaoC family dehydratase N-terminal domain-containing protein [Chloroflexota bacterium]
MTFDEVKARFHGKGDDPEVYEVEKGSAKRYAVAADDLNPLYLDEETAANSKYGAIVAPPGFFGWPVKQPSPRFPKLMQDMMEALADAGFPDILDGGSDYEFHRPARAGDTIVCSRKVADLFSRGGSSGRKMAFFVIENSFTNQNGQLVCKMRQTIIALSKVTQ